MRNPALGQQLKGLSLCAAGLLVAILLGFNIGSENYRPLLLGAVILIVACVALFSGRFFWVLTIASSFLTGTFPILGGAFTPFQILMVIGIAKFLIGDVVLRRTRLKTSSRFDALMITGFMGILTWHGIHDRFGMRFLGSTVWGGHNYINVYVGLVAFFVVQSIPTSPKIWAKLPYVVLAMTTFDLLIAVITTIFPGSIYVIYPFYSAVSSSSFEEAVTGNSLDITGRIGTFGSFGFVLVLIVLASIPLTQIFSPQNFFRLVAAVGGSITALYSGFRSAVINVLFGFVVAGIRDLKFAVVLLLPIFAAILFVLSAVNSEFFPLPKQIQRSIAFFPGKWDADMARDAAGSNEFRRKTWEYWARDYFPKQPWFGRGFGFKSEWATRSTSIYSGAVDYHQMVETGSIHNGLFAAIDTFGLVGTVFFTIWTFRLFARTFRIPPRRNHPANAALRFLSLYLAVWIISYWFGAFTVGSFLPQEFAIAAVLIRLREAMAGETDVNPSGLKPPQVVAGKELATA